MRAALVLPLLLAGCGAKTGLVDDPFDAGPLPDAAPECEDDADCDDGVFCNGQELCARHRCARGVRERCADGDLCSADRCDAELDECVHDDLRVDGDGDGFYPLDCGPDCDDEDALVYPGAPERCNGKDDDCDGTIDEDLSYTPTRVETRVTENLVYDAAAGLAWTEDHWVTSHYDQADPSVYMTLLDENGERMGEDEDISRHPGDAYGAGIVWSGRVLGAVWEDRRDGDFEIYFQRLNDEAQKLQADLRITTAFDFSINPTIAWSGDEFALAWQDSRFQGVESDNDEILFQRVTEGGQAVGFEVQATDTAGLSGDPSLAWGDDGWGLAWTELVSGTNYEIFFRRIGADGSFSTDPVQITVDGGESTDADLVWADGEWGIVWEENLGTCAGSSTGSPGTCFARLSPAGDVLFERRVDDGSALARFSSIVWTGSAYLILWSDSRDGGTELYYVALDEMGETMLGDTRITDAAGDSYGAVLDHGEGEYGVLFTDTRDGNAEVYFTSLTCEGAPVAD